VARDLINAAPSSVARLRKVFRRPASSRIITTSPRHHAAPSDSSHRGWTSDTSISCAWRLARAGGGLDLQVSGRAHPARFWPRSNAQVQVAVPDGRGWLLAPAHSTSSCEARLSNPTPPSRWKRFGCFCPADKVMQVATRLREEVFTGDVGHSWKHRCRCQANDGALSLGRIREQRQGREVP